MSYWFWAVRYHHNPGAWHSIVSWKHFRKCFYFIIIWSINLFFSIFIWLLLSSVLSFSSGPSLNLCTSMPQFSPLYPVHTLLYLFLVLDIRRPLPFWGSFKCQPSGSLTVQLQLVPTLTAPLISEISISCSWLSECFEFWYCRSNLHGMSSADPEIVFFTSVLSDCKRIGQLCERLNYIKLFLMLSTSFSFPLLPPLPLPLFFICQCIKNNRKFQSIQ